jgi:flagellar secretion chaperone FliS
MNSYEKAMNHYKNIELQTRVDTATPHELILLLIQGAKSHIAVAKGNIERKETSNKGEHIGKAISILEGLQTSLNHEKGKEIAANLDNLYEYIQQILLKANIDNNTTLLDEAINLLNPIHQAWLEIDTSRSN